MARGDGVKRLLVIPAAGRGSRLEWPGAKALCPVAGRPMVDWLIARYAPLVDLIVLVAAPTAEREFREHVAGIGTRTAVVVQPNPTGMLPAILCARSLVQNEQPEQVWITWCDQIGISRATADTLAGELDRHSDAALVFPTVRQAPPYIHFARNADGRIIRVLQQREGDPMPPAGESDAGLFGLRRESYLTDLVDYEADAPTGDATHERNFLPFVPWLAGRKPVRTFDLGDPREAIGVNTQADIAVMEAFLLGRA